MITSTKTDDWSVSLYWATVVHCMIFIHVNVDKCEQHLTKNTAFYKKNLIMKKNSELNKNQTWERVYVWM